MAHLTPDEIDEILRALDDRTRRIQADTFFLRSRLDRLTWKVAALAGVVATLVSLAAK